MKKILFFINTLYQGGAETLVKDYALLIDKKKFNVTILCLHRMNTVYEKMLQDNGIEIIFLYDNLTFSFSSFIYWCRFKLITIFHLDYFWARMIVKRIKPDIIHAHLFVLRYLRQFDLNKVKKIFYTVHSEPQKYWHCKTKDSKEEYESALWLVKNKQMQLIALQEPMRVELNSMFNTNNTIIVNNGIDFSRFSHPRSTQDVRQELNIPMDAFVVGHVGRFAEPKNHFFILDTFYKLSAQKKNAFLLLVGDGSMRNEIVRTIAKLHLEKKVKIISNRTDVPDLLNAMDVFFFPSLYEGLGIALIEAQKMKLPCVISNQIPSAATISNLITVLSLEDSKSKWIDALCKPKPLNIEYIKLEKWDMNNIVKDLETMYSNNYHF